MYKGHEVEWSSISVAGVASPKKWWQIRLGTKAEAQANQIESNRDFVFRLYFK